MEHRGSGTRWTVVVGLAVLALLLASGPGKATPTFTVTTTADTQDAAPGDGTCADSTGACSLRAAVEEANALDTTVAIDVAAGTYKTTIANPTAIGIQPGGANPTTGDIDVTATISIVGAGAGSTILDAGNLDREFYVHTGGTLTLNGVTVRHGFSQYDCAGGFAIYNEGTLQLTDAAVADNVANCGNGGAIDNAGTFGATGTTFANNTMNNTSGGALYNTGSASVDSSTFSGNSSHTGGAIASSGTLTLTNVTLSGNSAATGGGLDVTGGTAVLKSDTLTANSAWATNGGAVQADGGATTLEDSIVSGNGTADCHTAGGTVTSAGHNIDGGTTCGLAGPGDQTGTDPLLVGLAWNGGPVQTAALAFGSPAIGAGDSSCPAADARGVSRGTCDVGAYQYSAPSSLTVTRVDDPAGAGTCPLDCSLRQAVATLADGGTISLPAGAYVLGQGALTLSRNLTIAGAGASTTSISQASLSGYGRVLYVPGGTISVSGVTIEHGNTDVGDGEPNAGVGGGIWIDSPATATLSRVTVSSNSASTSGGGIDNDGALTIDRSLISGNTASGASLEIGGGIDHWGSSLVITNTTIANNHAALQGGGLESGGASTLKNVTISNNVAGASGGGGVWGGATLVNTLLDSNTLADGTAENCSSGVSSLGHNLSTDASCSFSAPGDLVGVSASAGVDAGDDAQCTAVDQAGTARPQGPHCDIGALETTVASSSGGSSSGGSSTGGSTTTTTTTTTPAPPPPAPAPPVAHLAVSPAAPAVGTVVSFDGSASTGAAAYAWSFGDGATGTGVAATHAFSAPGIYPVGLTVTAADGSTASSTQLVVVSSTPAAPAVSTFELHAPSHPFAGTPLHLWVTGAGPAPRKFGWWVDEQRVCAASALCTWTPPAAGDPLVRVEDVDGNGTQHEAQLHVKVWPLTNPEAQLSTIQVARVARAFDHNAGPIGRWTASVLLRDANGPIHGHQVQLSFSSHTVDAVAGQQATGPGSSSTGFALSDTQVEQVTVTAHDQTTGIVLAEKPTIWFTKAPSESASAVTVDSSQTVADGVTTVTATVKLVDGLGNPVPAETVSLLPEIGNGRVPTRSTTARVEPVGDGTTDAAGTAQFTVADTAAEVVSLEAEVPGDAVKLLHAPDVRFVTAAALGASASDSTVTAPPAIAAGGSGIATVTVRDGLGDPLAGRTVRLYGSGSASADPASAVTDANGQASFTVGDPTAEHVELTATDVTDETTLATSAPVSFYAPGVSSATSSLSFVGTDTTSADGATALTALVRLRDAGGFAVPGVHVSLSSGGSAHVLPASGVTDANGDARFAVTDATVEDVSIRAKVDAAAVVLQPVTASFVSMRAIVVGVERSGEPGGMAKAGGSAANSPATTPGWYRVDLRLMNGTGPARHKEVSLETSSNGVVVRPPLYTGNGSAAGTTDPNGDISFYVDSSAPQTVTLHIHDVSDQLFLGTVDLPFTGRPDPTKSSVAVAPATVADDGVSYATITATLLDSRRKPVPGETVTALSRGGHQHVSSGISDASGIAVLKVRDPVQETVTLEVLAQEDGVALAQRNIHFVPASQTGVSASKSTVVPDGDVPADGVSAAHVVVTLKDGGGAALPGKTVSLHADGGSSTISQESAVTDPSGHAVFSVTDATLEQVTYSAVDETDSITLAQTAPVFFFDPLAVSAATSSVVASPIAVDADGATPATVTVTLRNRGGAPLPGQPVALASSGTGTTVTPASTVTDALGAATFSVVDTASEPVTLTATDALQPDLVLPTATVTFGAPQPPTVTIAGVSGTLQAFAKHEFHATVSDPSGAAIVSYAWSFGDGTTSSDRQPFHGYAAAGTYSVTLHVTDARGATGSATRVLTVAAGTDSVSAPAYAPLGISAGALIQTSGPHMHSATFTAAGGSSERRALQRGSTTPLGVPLPYTDVPGPGHSASVQVYDDVPETVDYVVTAPGGYRADVAITYVVAAVAEQSSVDLSKHKARADHADTIFAHVHLRDQDGNPTPNNVVTLSASRLGGGWARATIKPTEALTDANGVATFELVDATGEDIVVHATDVTGHTYLGPSSSSTGVAIDAASARFEQVLPASSGKSTLAAASTVVHTFAPGTSVTVRLLNKYGGVEVGKEVSLAATGSATVTPATATTDATGTVTFRVVDGTAQTVSVSATDVTDSVAVAQKASIRFADHTVDAAASSVLASQGSAPAASDTGVQVTVTLKDATGAPVGATIVHLHPSSSQSTVSDASLRTDSSGRATFTVNDLATETVAFTATAEVGTSTLVTITQKGTVQFTAPVASASASSLTPPSLSVPYFQNPSFSVVVRDGANRALAARTVRAVFVYADSGNDYPDGHVTLSPAGPDLVDSHGWTVHTGQGTTDATGSVTFTFSSNNEPGGPFPRWFKVDVQVAEPDGSWLDLGTVSLDYLFEFQH